MVARCPACGATWSCGAGCPDWGYGGRGWRSGKGQNLAVFDTLLENRRTWLSTEEISKVSGVPDIFALDVLYRMYAEGSVTSLLADLHQWWRLS